MLQHFNPSSTNPRRAVQAWQILIAAAMNRQIHSYKTLSELMYGKPVPNVMSGILGHIAFYCVENGLPPLNVLVVNETTGLPGDGIPVSQDLNSSRESVYQYGWYNLYPPAEQEFAAAYERNQSE
ncbi:hypothetical protein [Neisseria sp.]|uniref:hypothetical protein n=1 Tax=Neisseria sp. TaxID=192066 RepID=UPI0035A005D5